MPESGEEGETTGVKPPYIYKCEGTYLQGKKEMRDFGFTSFYVVELLLVEIELGREIVNYTSKNNVS